MNDRFAVKADFLFHAASGDTPVSRGVGCGLSVERGPGCAGGPQDYAPGEEGGSHGYDADQTRVSTDGGPGERGAGGRSNAASRNGEVGRSFCAEAGEEEERPSSSIDESGEERRSRQRISNANCVPSSTVAHCNSTAAVATRDPGPLEGAGPGTDQGEGQGAGSAGAEPQGCGVGDVRALKEKPDLVIEVGGKNIQAHKSVLAEKSDYFRARQSRDILKVKGVSYGTLAVLVEYAYSSRMAVDKDTLVEVIAGARVLQIPCAVQAATDAVCDQITAENCYQILSVAKKQRLCGLKEAAYRFMSDNFLRVLRDPAVYGRLTGSERDMILKTRMEGKKSLLVAEINDVYDRAGSRPPSRNSSRPQSPLSLSSSDDVRMIYSYDEATDRWTSLTLIPEDINTKGCGICTMYNYLFVAGGIRGCGDKGRLSDKVFCYNPVTDSWSEIRPLNQARSQLKLVCVDGYLYAVGGECLFSVERYDPRADRWSAVANLPKGAFAVAHEATACNGELYVSGGSLFHRLLRYDPRREEWEECPYNNSRKRSTDMVALRNFLYRFDVGRERGVSVYKYNAIVKTWRDCAALPQANAQPFRCAVIGRCVYCVNRAQTLRFAVGEDEEETRFEPGQLRAPAEARGVLFPFVLTLPDRAERNA